jgi:hypothetical protein
MLQTEKTSKRNSFFYTGADMLPAILNEVTKAERTINGWAYQIDHRDIISAATLRVARYGVECRLIFDKENFFSSTCARQATGVNELYRAGCLLRIRKPPGGLYSCIHVKSLIFDGKVAMSGSLNLTHNGLQNNKEHLYRLSEPEFIQEMMADFEKDWILAEPVGDREISIMIAKDLARKDERQAFATQTIPIRQDTAESGPTLKNGMKHPDWRNHLELDIKDGSPVAFRMATPDGGPVAFRPRQVDTVGPAQRVPPQQTEPQESTLVHFPRPAYVSVGANRSKDVSRFDDVPKSSFSGPHGAEDLWHGLPSRISSQPGISEEKGVHTYETQESRPRATAPSTVWSDRGPGGLVVAESKASVSDVRADAKEKCDRLMRNRIAEERKGGGGRPSARGQGTVESYVNAGQQKESTYEMDVLATGGLLSTCRVPPKKFLAESRSSNHP